MKLLRPLRERDFALLWAGMTVSLLGDGIFIVPVIVSVVLYVVVGVRGDQDLHPLLGEVYAGAGASADSGSGTPAIS